MSNANLTRAARVILVILLSLGDIGACRAESRPVAAYDRVGAGEMAARPDLDAVRHAAERADPAGTRGPGEADKRLETRKGELARRMFWIMLSLR